MLGSAKRIRTAAFLVACGIFTGCGGSDGGVTLPPTTPQTPQTPQQTCQDYLTVTAGSVPTPQGLWKKLSPTGTPPSERWLHAAAYDAANDKMIVFGGQGAAGASNEVWILNGATTDTPLWSQLSQGGSVRPAARYSSVVAYDASLNRLIVFGGTDGSNRILTDAWILSNANGLGGAPVWTQLTIAGGIVLQLTDMSGVYDSKTGRLLLFGGVSCSPTQCTPSAATYSVAISGTTATLTSLSTPGTTLPNARFRAASAMDNAGSQMFIFGGATSTTLNIDPSSARSDLWSTSTGAWTSYNTTTTPPARLSATLVHDGARGKLALFSGTGADNIVRNDLWTLKFGGGDWTQIATGTPVPTARTGSVAIYSPATDRMVVFGGNIGNSQYVNDVWTIRVTPPGAKTIQIVAASTTVCAGNQVQFYAVVTDSTGTVIPATITWSTSDITIVDIGPDGRVVAKTPGTAQIKACFGTICAQQQLESKQNTNNPTPPPSTGGGSSTLRIRTDLVGIVDGCNDSFNNKTTNLTAKTLFADGGSVASGYTWTISSGSTYPPGITVDALTGIVHRTSPTSTMPAGTYRFNMTVSDGSATARADLTLIVTQGSSALDPVLQIPSNPCPLGLFAQSAADLITLVDGKTGRSYASSLYVLAGADPDLQQTPVSVNLTWRLASGQLPPGLVIDQARGVVRGTPSTPGTYNFTISVTNSRGQTALTPSGKAPTYRIVIQ